MEDELENAGNHRRRTRWPNLGVDIENNIIYQNGHSGIGCYGATGSGVVVDHNLVYQNGYGSL